GRELRRCETGRARIRGVEPGICDRVGPVALDLPHEPRREPGQQRPRGAREPVHGTTRADESAARGFEVPASEPRDVLYRRRAVRPSRKMVAVPRRLRAGVEGRYGRGDEVDGHDVERALAAKRQWHQSGEEPPPEVEGDEQSERGVESLLARRRAGRRVAYDDRRAVDRDGKLASCVATETLGLELALLVAVPKALANVELVLEDE